MNQRAQDGSRTALVLGAGMVGSVMAADLAADGHFSVTIVDRDEGALAAARRRGGDAVTVTKADLAEPASLVDHVAAADVVLGAAPSHLGRGLLSAMIDMDRPYCDISFMPEEALDLHERARQKGTTAIVDCGVAPGLSNMLAARGVELLDETTSIAIYVGGLPVERHRPFEYKAGFAPSDVLEEYTRPSRLVEAGQTVVRTALSEREPLEFEGVGTLEAFNTDGLRSLIRTLDVPNMKEKTLRYPGHAELMEAFRAVGLMDPNPVNVRGVEVRPLDLLSQLMFPLWTYEEGEADLTAMRVIVNGRREGAERQLTWDLLHRYDPQTRTTSMARTTASPCVIVARLLADGAFKGPGVFAPERLGREPALFDHIIDELATRGVTLSFDDAVV